jgi:GNAT superfamily N-acetyltransferase
MIRLAPNIEIHKLEPDIVIESFDCGDPDLNDFILNEASNYRKALLAVTYVAVDTEVNKIVAYFSSLANDRVSLTDFENLTEFNRFRRHRFVNEKRIKSYPAAKICRLAVSKSAQGRDIGSNLLYFIKSFFLLDNKTGCRFLTVDAYSEAVNFYKKLGFEYLNHDDADTKTRLLYYDLAMI